MTYQLKLDPPLVNIELCSWFQKSYESIDDIASTDVDLVDARYEKKFGVRLVYGTPESKDAIKPIDAVEFPNESDAVLFVLKWS